MDKKLEIYLHMQRRTVQWNFFLQAFAQELPQRMSQEEIRTLMHDTGRRTGEMLILPLCDSIEEIEQAANQHWAQLGWGYVYLEERSDYLAIEHRYAPLEEVFGEGAVNWAGAFLEGVYQQWFAQMGASSSLLVKQAEIEKEGCLLYSLKA